MSVDWLPEPQSRKEEAVQLERDTDMQNLAQRLFDVEHTVELLQNRMDDAAVFEELARDGYERGLGHVSAVAAAIDRRAVEESTCEACGHKQLRYEPWHQPGNYRSYRAFAVCGNCGHREEF